MYDRGHWHVKEYRCGIESVRKVAMKGTETGEKRRLFSSWFYFAGNLEGDHEGNHEGNKKGTNLEGNHDGDERRKPEKKQ